jgi:hypothetical protein
LKCRNSRAAAHGQDDVRRESEQFRDVFAYGIGTDGATSDVDLHILAVRPTQFLQLLPEHRKATIKFWIGPEAHAYAPYALPLLRVRRYRPRDRRAAEQRNELAPLQSIELHLLPQPGTSWQHTALAGIKSGGSLQCGISTRPMTASGLGRVKTQARVASVENLKGIAHRESQIMLRILWLDTP